MSSVRERRLAADHERIKELSAASGSALEIVSATGRPPSQYVLTYRCPGLARLLSGRKPEIAQLHSVQIDLPAGYPIQGPLVRFLTPIFHPHVFPNTNLVCIGTWTINEQLDQLVLRIGALIQGDPQYLNFSSPANHVAADWTKANMRALPFGTVTFKQAQGVRFAIDWKELK